MSWASPLTPLRNGEGTRALTTVPSSPPPGRRGAEGEAIAHLRLEFGEIV